MKTQQNVKQAKGSQGNATADRAFTNQHDTVKQHGISNGGGQRSDQTSSKDGLHKPKRKSS